MYKHKVYLLESKYHGSNQQLRSVAREIFRGYEVISLKLELRSRAKILYSFYWLLLNVLNRTDSACFFSRHVKKLILKGYLISAEKISDGDVILSKTPPFEYPAAMLKAGSDAKLYHFGELKRLDRKYVDYVISTPSTPAEKPDISLDVMPTEMSLDNFLGRKEAYSEDKYYLMLIGGDARGFYYNDTDWESIIRFIEHQSKTYHVNWVISTSPRTGKRVERYIKERLIGNSHIKELVLWNMGGRKGIADCLSGSEVVFVTEDSASMLSDAINCQLPTVSIRPCQAGFNSLTTPLANYHESKNSILRVKTSQLSCFDFNEWVNREFCPVECCWTESWNKQIKFL